MELYIIGLQAFADAGGSAAEGGAALNAGEQGGNTAAEAGTQDQKKEAKKRLADLIDEDPDYKKEYDEAVRRNINRRFRSVKATEEKLANAEERLAKYEQTLPYLAQKYGLSEDDVDGIMKAVRTDDDLFKRRGAENGTSGRYERESFEKELESRRQKAENDRLNLEIKRQREKMEADAIAARWRQEAAETQQKYPDFNFEREYESNELFRRLCRLIPVTDAYEQVHRREIDAAFIEHARKEATDQVAGTVAANMSRPAEGGIAGTATTTIKRDPSSLSDEERLDVRRRLKRGERVTFS